MIIDIAKWCLLILISILYCKQLLWMERKIAEDPDW